MGEYESRSTVALLECSKASILAFYHRIMMEPNSTHGGWWESSVSVTALF